MKESLKEDVPHPTGVNQMANQQPTRSGYRERPGVWDGGEFRSLRPDTHFYTRRADCSSRDPSGYDTFISRLFAKPTSPTALSVEVKDGALAVVAWKMFLWQCIQRRQPRTVRGVEGGDQ